MCCGWDHLTEEEPASCRFNLWPRFLSRLAWRTIRPDCPEGQVARPLMTRWFVFRSKPFAIFIHRFHRSDLDEYHDHPWSFIAIPFSSGYWENTRKYIQVAPAAFVVRTDRFWRRRFSILYRPAESQHYIEIPKPLFTLVFRFRERRQWGFIDANGQWFKYDEFESMKSRSICNE